MKRTTLIKLALINSLVLSPIAWAAPTQLWQNAADYVAIKASPDTPPNQHPYPLKADALAPLLSQVQVAVAESTSLLGNREGERHHRVFSDREIDLLAHQLSSGLNQAARDEVVVFSVSDLRAAYFGEKSLTVSGTAFVRDNKLNLLFGEIHVDLQKKYVRSGQSVSNSRFASKVELARFRLPTGDQQQAVSHDWHLLSFTGATTVADRSDWLAVDLNRTYNYQLEQSEPQKTLKYVAAAEQEHDAALEARIQRLEQQQDAPPAAGEGFESRLRKLKALYEQGMIPDDVYKQRVQAIVNEM